MIDKDLILGGKMKILIVVLILFAGIISCSDSGDEYMNDAVITGIDVRECSCCGGYYIDIESITYRFYELPANSGIDLTDGRFPVHVKLDWQNDPDACLGDEIIVLRIDRK